MLSFNPAVILLHFRLACNLCVRVSVRANGYGTLVTVSLSETFNFKLMVQLLQIAFVFALTLDLILESLSFSRLHKRYKESYFNYTRTRSDSKFTHTLLPLLLLLFLCVFRSNERKLAIRKVCNCWFPGRWMVAREYCTLYVYIDLNVAYKHSLDWRTKQK